MPDVNMRHGKGASRHQSDMQPLLLCHPGASQDVAVQIKVKGNMHLLSNVPSSSFLLALLIYHSANPESPTTKTVSSV